MNVERGAVVVASGYDGRAGSATFATIADVQLTGPLGLRTGFTYLPGAQTHVFQPHVGLRVQLLRQNRHGIDGALGVFYRMERFTEDEGLVQLVSSLARQFDGFSLFANLAYGQDPEGDDRDGEVRAAAQLDSTSALRLGFDGRVRFDLFSSDGRRAMRGASDLDFAAGPLATLTWGRLALVGQAGVSGVRVASLRAGVLATMGVASVF